MLTARKPPTRPCVPRRSPRSLCQTGELSGAIRIPDTVGQLVVTADLRAGKVTCHVDVDAPREGRPTTRVNWLVRQLKNAPDTTRVEAFVAHARGSSAAELLSEVRENPASLVVDPTKELRTFRVAPPARSGTKRGRGRGSFIDSVLTPATASTPKSRLAPSMGSRAAQAAATTRTPSPELDDSVSTSLASNDYSSQDGATVVAVVTEAPSERTELPAP